VMFGPLEPDLELPAALPTATPIIPTTSMQVWEGQPALDIRLQQEIGVFIGFNEMPLSGSEPTLILTLPDKSKVVYKMAPTGMDGKSVYRLPLLKGPNGAMISYSVCVLTLAGERFCGLDSFVIWSNP
jgi:hypothetical protein